jgi:hypothetical protein
VTVSRRAAEIAVVPAPPAERSPTCFKHRDCRPENATPRSVSRLVRLLAKNTGVSGRPLARARCACAGSEFVLDRRVACAVISEFEEAVDPRSYRWRKKGIEADIR